MSRQDEILATVEAVHAAGLDERLWPTALAAMAALLGGNGASIEVMERPSLRHIEMHSFALPAVDAYLEHYAPLAPRRRSFAFQRAGSVCWDYQVVDEAMIDKDPFYVELLAPHDMRYYLAGIVADTKVDLTIVGIQRSRRQGHPSPADIALMGRLLPHVRQAFDVTHRLRLGAAAKRSLENALDWLADGVVVVGGDGKVLHVNGAAEAIAGRGDGIGIGRGGMTFAAPAAQVAWRMALASVTALRGGGLSPAIDFVADRLDSSACYRVSVRPLLSRAPAIRANAEAAAIVFIHDPIGEAGDAVDALRAVFGLTAAEAGLAKALQSGVAPSEYANLQSLSLNTVYTHLRRIKEKTGCRRLSELIAKLKEIQVRVRRG